MAISVDWPNKIVESTADILDLPAFKEAVRILESSDAGVLYDPIITYKKVSLGSGSYFHAVDFINGYQLKFPNAGNYLIEGNLNCTIVPVAGVFVDRTKAAAFATVSGSGGGGATAADVWSYASRQLTVQLLSAADVWAHATRTLSEAVGLTPEQATQLAELHTLEGLNPGQALVVSPTRREAGSIVQDISEGGDTVTVTRQ
jgi:hypothetical protein